jgi:hypothetical protein
MTRAVWIGAALGAAGLLAVLALHGERPDPAGLARFEAAGVMLAIEPAQVTAVEVRRADGHWRFRRASDGAWAADDAGPAGAGAGTALNEGLRFLHGSAPQRVLDRGEVAGIPMSEYGLEPPGYVVTVRGPGTPFTVEFGAVNPQGLAQYARVAGRDEIFLLPRFVGRSWETAIGVP